MQQDTTQLQKEYQGLLLGELQEKSYKVLEETTKNIGNQHPF